MNEMIVKDVEFNGTMLRAAQVSGIVYVGIKWVCEGLGLEALERDYENHNKRIFDYKPDRKMVSLGMEIENINLLSQAINTRVFT